MSTSYSVDCDLSLENYDDPRAGFVAASGAFAEVRRLGLMDERVHATRMRRGSELTVEISITVRATTHSEAFDLCRAILRTAVHANGGNTAGWEHLQPEIRSAPATRRDRWRLRRRRRPQPVVLPAPPAQDWATLSQTVRARGSAPAWLPPLAPGAVGELVIDLR